MFGLLLFITGTIAGVAGAVTHQKKTKVRPLIKRIEALLLEDGWEVWTESNFGPLLYNRSLGITIYFEQRLDQNCEYVPVAFRIRTMPVSQKLLDSESKVLRSALFAKSERFVLDAHVRLLEEHVKDWT